MKKCVDCHFFKRGTVETPHGPQLAFICTHEECGDPVNGEPLLCGQVRTNAHFCGMDARYYKKREDKPVDDKKVIQLS